MTHKRSLRVAIIGAGMSGICMAVKLQDAGIDSFTIFEKADDVGGTWRDNSYPGLTCDVPSRYYSYSFRPNPHWSHWLPPGPEIQAYFQQVADERGIRSHIRFGTNVTTARYDDGKWRLDHAQRRRDIRRPRHRDRSLAGTSISGHPRPGHVRRSGVPFVALGSFGLLAGQADRFDRHRLDRCADHRGARRQSARPKIFQRTAQWIYPLPNVRYSNRLRQRCPGGRD